jgi:four helix bundle protein
MTLTHYRDLIAWQKAMSLVTCVYEWSKQWPDDERFGLTAQIRRAAVSIPSNIAEGQGRFGNKEFARYLSMAHGSLMELETQLQIACNLGYLSPDHLATGLAQSSEIGKIINGLLRKLATSP